LAAFRRKTADSTGRVLSCLDKSKRSSTWKAPELVLLCGESWGNGNGAASIFNHDAEPKFALGTACFMDASPVVSSVILFGG